jgi:thioredoxin 1
VSTVAMVFGAVLVAGLALMGLLQAFVGYKAREAVGKEVPDFPPGRLLLYFMSPTCGPCRAMTPAVRRLSEQGARVRVVDVSQDPSLALQLGVMGTPTVMVVQDGKVEDVLVGPQPAERLAALVG